MPARYEHIASADEAGMRLDVLLAALPQFPSRSAAVRTIEAGEVSVDGQARDKNYLVREGDRIAFEPVEMSSFRADLSAYGLELDVRYEDEGFLILSKPAGLVCHPSPGHDGETLVNALIAHCGRDHLANLQGDDRLGIVHRLDMDTSGLMLAAKDDEVGYALQDGIRTRNIDRRYLCLVHGYIAPDTGSIDAPIGRDPKVRLKMAVIDGPSARSAVTTFRVLERFEAGPRDDGYTLIECKLFSGRTHQIRVHMDYIGHCVVGDPFYGKGLGKKGKGSAKGAQAAAQANLGLTRQFLHSWRLVLEHPETGELLDFVDALPDDLADALTSLGGRSMGRTRDGEELMALLAAAPQRVYTRSDL